MKKDLRALREVDALKEKDKIAKIKTLEEQVQESQTKPMPVPIPPKPSQKDRKDMSGLKKVLETNAGQEKLAEKNLKQYAAEQERQQIFLLESQRLDLMGQIDAIDKEKIPALKLEKNKLDVQKRGLYARVKPISDQENKLENEQAVVIKEAKESAIPSQKKSLEQRRWEIDKEIKETEKKRWTLEKQIQDIDEKIKETDNFLAQLTTTKNSLQDKILNADKSLREVYSGIISRVEEQRKGQTQEQKTKEELMQKTKLEEHEKIRREQWLGVSAPKKKEFLKSAPENFKEKMAESAAKEEEQRKQFLQDVEKNYNASDAN